MVDLDELASKGDFTLAATRSAPERTVTFLPEPPRQERKYTVISVDDHIVEPRNLFEGRIPSRLAERAPKVVEKADGSEVWVYDGVELPNVGFNAVAGRPPSEFTFEPVRFDEMRRGAWDIHERISDMDLNGVFASINFPSFLAGFSGQRLQQTTKDRDLALACVRAWNDWHLEEWAGTYPDRIIPCQLPWLLDPERASEEIYRNADRGFKAVTFSEAPHLLGLPSLHTGYWDPVMRACAETGTVVNLHVGSSGTSPSTAPDAPPDTVGALFFAYAMFATVDWLYSKIPLRMPDIKIALSEGGIGWVAGLLDRLDHMLAYHEMYGTWPKDAPTPAEVVGRNFWFCALDDPSSLQTRDRIGIDHIMVESDYPHCDSTWPHTQDTLARQLADLSEHETRRITWENASELYRHPVPQAVVDDPNAF
jgi:predicted TIM-barrel fold metal-dependent hydrolase